MLGHRPAVARVSIELTTSALWARRSEPTELSRHGWPPRNRTARYLRIRQAPSTTGSWPADGGGPDPQRSRALPGSSRSRPPGRFAIRERRAEVLSPTASRRPPVSKRSLPPVRFTLHGGRRWTRSTGPSPPPAFQTGTTTWWFHLPRRRAGDSYATVLPAHPLATEPGTLAGSPSMSAGRERRTARYLPTCAVVLSPASLRAPPEIRTRNLFLLREAPLPSWAQGHLRVTDRIRTGAETLARSRANR